jgi:hypothetical protein
VPQKRHNQGSKGFGNGETSEPSYVWDNEFLHLCGALKTQKVRAHSSYAVTHIEEVNPAYCKETAIRAASYAVD